MRILCLCPTYGRNPSLLENTLACFLSQTYKNKFLLIFDDLGNMDEIGGDSWAVYSTSTRLPHLPAKYHYMLEIAENSVLSWDAIAVWDDDDIYLPKHLENAASVLQEFPWAYPEFVYGTYGMPFGEVMREPAGGRFHGSVVVRKDWFNTIGGWSQNGRADFDQNLISKLGQAAHGHSDISGPTYVYRWQDTGESHCSGHMKSPDDESWYSRVAPAYHNTIKTLVPKFDEPAKAIYQNLGCWQVASLAEYAGPPVGACG